MVEQLQENWLLVIAALVALLLVAWWAFVASRRARVEIERRLSIRDSFEKTAGRSSGFGARLYRKKDPRGNREKKDPSRGAFVSANIC